MTVLVLWFLWSSDLYLLNNGPKVNSGDAGKLDMPKRGPEEPPQVKR